MITTHKLTLATLAVFCIALIANGQTPQDSALIPIASAKATSEDRADVVAQSFDGIGHTLWQSQPDFPVNFFTRAGRNLFLNTSAQQLSSSSPKGSLTTAVDGNLKTGFNVNSGNWFTINLLNPTNLHVLTLKASVKTTISIFGFNAKGDSIKIGEYTRGDHYSVKKLAVAKSLTKVKLHCNDPYLLFEIAACEEAPTEDLFYDFGKSYSVKGINLEFRGCTTADSVVISLSEDGVNWTSIAKPDPTEFFAKNYSTNSHGQYARIRFFIKDGDYNHGKLGEVAFYGKEYKPGAGGGNGGGSGSKTPVMWDPLAGLWPPHTKDAVFSASSEDPSNPISLVTDGIESTGWRSDAAFPSNFMSRKDRNLMLQSAMISSVIRSNGGTLKYWNDGDQKTGDQIKNTLGERWLKVHFNLPQYIHLISMKASNKLANVEIIGYLSNGDSVKLDTYSTLDHYSVKRVLVDKKLTGLKLKSNQDFLLFELAALDMPMYEDVLVDFGSAKEVGWIYTNFRNSQWIDSTLFEVSNDLKNWTTVAKPDHQYYFELAFKAKPRLNARYGRLRIFVKEQDYARAELSELTIRDLNGLNGPMPTPKQATRPLKDLMGINGIRGWGHGGSSNTLDTNQGPHQYNRVATYGRNYHNMSWDTRDPDHTPDYNKMPGSLRFTWLNWDDEYDTWNQANLGVQVSLQFLNISQPQKIWDNPWQAAYNIGYNFALHFGPTHGVGNVAALEIGNEPWDYEKNFYRTVLNGMAKGAKDADPALKVFSGALQAGDPSREENTSGNFIGERLTETEAPFLDGINSHHYSYMTDPVSQNRISTYPENPLSGFRGILSDLRFRDHNMPGTEYHVSEWGWGSDGAGQSCNLTECVTEKAQALYAARGLFMMDRLGVDRSMWYFYANLPGSGSMYSRCGLTGPVEDGSVKKLSFHVFETIKQQLGNSYFLQVLQEDENAWAYTYGDSLGNPQYIVAWKPIEEGNPAITQLSLNVGFPVSSAFELDGTPDGRAASLPRKSGTTISFPVSATPVVLKLANSAVVIKKGSTNPNNRLDLKPELYPNPNNGVFNLEFQTSQASDAIIRIMSLDGRMLHQQTEVLSPGTPTLNMDLSHLPKGTYMLEGSIQSQYSTDAQSFHKKLIITP